MKINTALLVQILKNQNHILYELASMHSSGEINSGIYCKDEISKKLQDETYKMIKDLT